MKKGKIKKTRVSTSAMTKRYLEKLGWIWGRTESYNSFTHQRNDLFGICDGIAIKGKEIMCVQACLGHGDPSAHRKKILANPLYKKIKEALPVYIFSWDKRGPAGKRKVWTVKIHRLEEGKIIKELGVL